MKIQKNKKRKGFTLVEMMIVIAIIGLLLAMLVPNLVGYRNSAVLLTERATQASIETAILAKEVDELEAVLNKTDHGTLVEWSGLNDFLDMTGTSITIKAQLGETAPAAAAGTWIVFFDTKNKEYQIIPPSDSKLAGEADGTSTIPSVQE